MLRAYKPIFGAREQVKSAKKSSVSRQHLLDAKLEVHNLAFQVALHGHFFWPMSESVELGDALAQIERDNNRDVKIKGRSRIFDELPQLTPEESGAIVDEYPAEEVQNQIVRKQKIKRLESLLGKENTQALLEGYSQGAAEFVARTLETGIEESEVDRLVIKNPPEQSRDINIDADPNVPESLRLRFTFREPLPIMDINSRLQGYFNPPDTTFSFRFTKVKGKGGAELDEYSTFSKDISDLFHGKVIPAEEIRRKYCSPEIAFEAMRKDLFDQINNGERDKELREQALGIVDFIEKNFDLKSNNQETNSLVTLFSQLYYLLLQGLMHPANSLDSEIDRFLVNLREELILKDKLILNANSRYNTTIASAQIALKQSKKNLKRLDKSSFKLYSKLNQFLSVMPNAALRQVETNFKIIDSKSEFHLISAVESLNNSQQNRYKSRIKGREELSEVHKTPGNFEDVETKTYSRPSSSPSTLTQTDLAQSQEERISEIRNNNWVMAPIYEDSSAFLRGMIILRDKQELSDPVENIAIYGNEAPAINGHLYFVASAESSESFEEDYYKPYETGVQKFLEKQLKEDGKKLFEFFTKSYHQELQNLVVSILNNPFMIEALSLQPKNEKEPRGQVSVRGRFTTNITQDSFGNKYINIIASELFIHEIINTTIKTTPFPGSISLRFQFTPEGPQLQKITTTNGLLRDFAIKNTKEMIGFRNRLEQAGLDEQNNFREGLAGSNEYIRRAWGNLSRIYADLTTQMKKNNDTPVFSADHFSDLQSLTNLVIQDPFNQTLLMHYRSSLGDAFKKIMTIENGEMQAGKTDRDQFNSYKQMQSAMERLISEAQLQREKKLLVEIVKQGQTLLGSPNLVQVESYIHLLEEVKQIPFEKKDGANIVEQMEKILEKNNRLVSLLRLKLQLKLLPSSFSSTVQDYLAEEIRYPQPHKLNEARSFFTDSMLAPVLSGHLKNLQTTFADAVPDSIESWKKTALLIAVDDLFDENGNVRKDIALIFESINGQIDWNDENIKKQLLESYIKQFIVQPLKKLYEGKNIQFTQELDTLQASNIVGMMPVVTRESIRELEDNLLTFADRHNKPSSLNQLIANYTYERNRFALATTVSNISVRGDVQQIVKLDKNIKTQGQKILRQTESLRKESDIPLTSLTKGLRATNLAIKDPTNSLPQLLKTSSEISKRPAGKVLGGLLLSLAGVLLLTTSLIMWPVTELLSPDLATKTLDASFAVIERGKSMAGLSDKDVKKKHAKNHSFFHPMRREYDEMAGLIQEKNNRPKEVVAVLPKVRKPNNS